MNLGYACINMELSDKGIMTTRGMIKKTFQSKGIKYASELALLNCKDLLSIVKWNNKNNIKLYRLSSSIFPWMSEYNILELPNIKDIKFVLSQVGKEALDNNQRLTFHPGQFNVLGSSKNDVVLKTIKELEDHSIIMDMIGLPENHYSKINIHVGASYGNKIETSVNWIKNFNKLNSSTRKRLTLENDDKKSLYSVKDLYDLIYLNTGVPIVYDAHHHSIGANDQSMSHIEALNLAVSTWGSIKPVCHMSSSAKLEGKNVAINAHSDYILSKFDNNSIDIELMLEAKMKEKSLFKYKKDFLE